MASGLDLRVYWGHLLSRGIDAPRLASYDRPIRSEPNIKPEQVLVLVLMY